MSTLTGKIDEARGLLSNLIFGRKQKKPREMIDNIKAYLHSLAIQQTIIAQQQQQQAISPAAAGAAGQTTTSSNNNSPILTNGSIQSPSNGNIATTQQQQQQQQQAIANTSTNTNSPLGAQQQQQQQQQQLQQLSIPSPANGSITLMNDPSQTSPQNANASESITGDLDQIVILLYGDASADSTSSGIPDPRLAREVIELMFEADLFRRLLENIRYLEFEARKFFTRIFEYVLTQRRELSIPYVLQRKHIVLQLIHAYEEKDVSIALACDAILRACIACEPITEMILLSGSSTTTMAASSSSSTLSSSGVEDDSNVDSTTYASSASSSDVDNGGNIDMVLLFFRYLDLPTFINSHVFATFKLLFQTWTQLGSIYLLRNYVTFFTSFNRLLTSENYLTKVQSFQFLGELLMERTNQEVMMRYVNESENLKLSMMALRGPKAIQLAVFNVLKIFLPNPFKPDSIIRILTQNKRNFLAFLEEFERDSEDEILIAHKSEMIQALLELPDVVQPLQKKSIGNANEETQTTTTTTTPLANSNNNNTNADFQSQTPPLSRQEELP